MRDDWVKISILSPLTFCSHHFEPKRTDTDLIDCVIFLSFGGEKSGLVVL
jgi:hypothetical protein